MDRARGEDHVDARPARLCERLTGGVDVLAHRARERGDRRAVQHPGDRLDALEVTGGCAREACLDDVDAEPLELLRDRRLLAGLQRDARRLLAVAQRRIEDRDPAGHEHFLLGSATEGAPVVR